MRSIWRSVLAVGGFVLLWQAIAWAGLAPREYFPAPLDVVDAAGVSIRRGEITRALALTFGRALAGLLAAIALGLLVAILSTRFALLGRALAPLADLFRALPPAAITPLSIFFLGLGWQLYAFILVFSCFWPVYMSAYAALNAVPRQQLASARVYGYEGWARMLRVQVPAALPETFIGIRLAAAVSLVAAIVAEMLAGQNGLGYLMSDAAFTLRIPDTFLGLIAAMLAGVIMNQLVLLARRLVVGWHEQMTVANRS